MSGIGFKNGGSSGLADVEVGGAEGDGWICSIFPVKFDGVGVSIGKGDFKYSVQAGFTLIRQYCNIAAWVGAY